VPSAIVTGAYGYLGSRVRKRLHEAGWTTVALVRSPRPGDRAEAWSLGEPAPPGALGGAHALVHCAYDFHVRRRREIRQVNVEGTATLLRSARDAGVARLLALSSMSAYPGTRQLYGQAKLAIEEIVVGLGGIAVRPGLVYGGEPGGIAAALEKLTRLPLVPVFGAAARQFPVHEDDFAQAIVDILEAPDWKPEVFGIAQPTTVTLRELLGALAARRGRRCRFVAIPWQPVYWGLRAAETAGAGAWLPVRADSLLGLVRPAPSVPPSSAFPAMLDSLRRLEA
jgi:nucleoside-diphosphate-sugar epimerase